jgi:hypothetical protein
MRSNAFWVALGEAMKEEICIECEGIGVRSGQPCQQCKGAGVVLDLLPLQDGYAEDLLLPKSKAIPKRLPVPNVFEDYAPRALRRKARRRAREKKRVEQEQQRG